MSSPHDKIVSCAIHPAIGIARVGSSLTEHFPGPEVPGARPAPHMRFKDDEGRIKRQAARFRIYGFNARGQVVQELTAADAEIEWRVHVANRKAGWYEFRNAMDLGPLAQQAPRRNADFPFPREVLVIDPGPRAIRGINTQGPGYRFNGAMFVDQQVELGEVRTDDKGRLLVLGGHGRSAAFNGARPLTFANNDGWFDDTSDGPVRATVRIGNRTLEAEPAMVVVAPPNYAPGLFSVVTMYDVVLDLHIRLNTLPPPPEKPSFWRDIFPIFERMVNLGHVNRGFFTLFGIGSPSDLLAPATLAKLATPAKTSAQMRQRLFHWFRDPDATVEQPAYLPPLYGDAFVDFQGVPGTGLAVTRTQFSMLRAWAEGRFTHNPKDRVVPAAALEAIPLADQPHALDRANLEECLGGPFHPGIEMTWTLRVPRMWRKPFRLNVLPEGTPVRMDFGEVLTPEVALGPGGPLEANGPGTLTRFMGVPWQTDEASCLAGLELGTYLPIPSFWAARVPNHVLPEKAYERLLKESLPFAQRHKHLNNRPEWLRHLSDQFLDRINNMVNQWDRVGIAAERPGPEDAAQAQLPERLWVETESGPELVVNDATFTMTLIAEGDAQPGIPAPEPVNLAARTAGATDTPEKRHGRIVARRDQH
ncbi:LodA/GoxA family CTQ-dependent oxidase [Stigmatella sp. ncwal1]|uniref:LodA/GoxA family CTQ-dependent oxidase n=1 Tax=Stigmatella ashevillensis TaxID=2995309 RepID=A0ABT5D2M6_9BACT|nr:LodA/GoxA family CTQ-dependent oxidase [Stigmatella ashevillena]MDC0707922.1 LodA/GoxA family CTQ-dependent oxidase [Stigmatella ashevillena]